MYSDHLQKKEDLGNRNKSLAFSKREKLQDQLNDLEETMQLASMSIGRGLDLVSFSSDVLFLKLFPTLRKRLESISSIDASKKTCTLETGWLKFIEDNLEKRIANITVQSGKICSHNICLSNTKHWTMPVFVQQDDVCLKLQFLDKDGNVVSPRDVKDLIRMETVDSICTNLYPNIGTIICEDETMSIQIKFAQVGEYYLKLFVCQTIIRANGFKISVEEKTIPKAKENNKKIDGLKAQEGTSETTSVTQKYLQEVLKDGDRVMRGPTWNWGDQDGGMGNQGTVRLIHKNKAYDGLVQVMWDKQYINVYRKDSQFADVILVSRDST